MNKSGSLRLVAEFSVIVVGVLVALLAESAWTERGKRAEERGILEWIYQDLAEDSSSMALDRAWVDMVVPAAAEARGILAGRDSHSAIGRLTVLYAASTIRQSPEQVRTWDDLIASGRISLIRDVEVRRAIMAFYGTVGALRTDQQALPTDFRTTVIAILPTDFTRGVLVECVRNPDGSDATLRADVEVALRSCTVDPGEAPATLLAQIRADPGIERSLGELTYQLAGIAETLGRAEQRFETLRGLLGASQAN